MGALDTLLTDSVHVKKKSPERVPKSAAEGEAAGRSNSLAESPAGRKGTVSAAASSPAIRSGKRELQTYAALQMILGRPYEPCQCGSADFVVTHYGEVACRLCSLVEQAEVAIQCVVHSGTLTDVRVAAVKDWSLGPDGGLVILAVLSPDDNEEHPEGVAWHPSLGARGRRDVLFHDAAFRRADLRRARAELDRELELEMELELEGAKS